jgi:glycosyltransferase involved in cell wall biosynthesis
MVQFSILSIKSTKRKIIDYLETKWLLKQYKKCDNTFIAISKNTQTYFKKALPKTLKKNIVLLPNAINSKLFSQKQKTLNTRHVRLINVGNLVAKKGHLLLIDVFHQLIINSNIKFTLDILGFGPLKIEIEEKINQLGLNEIIKLHGNVSNVADFMENSDIYIHTASYEPFGMVLIEAMASGLPIVSTDGKGNIDLIKNGLNGYLVDSRNPKEIAEKVIQITENANLYSKMSINAIKISKNYDIVHYVKKLEEIYSN